MTSRIFILGTGNIGCLIAHSIRSLRTPPPITLLLHRPEIKNVFLKQGRSIRVERDGIATIQRGFDFEVTERGLSETMIPREREPVKDISSLIVTTKAHQTASALKDIHQRLSRDSTVVFIQNGMGVFDEVNERYFPDEATRPNMVLGITSHGAHSTKPFNILQAGYGSIELGVVPRDKNKPENKQPVLDDFEQSTKETLQTLLQCYDLSYSVTSYPEILSLQLEKLAVNAVINALSVMFNCYNGQLLYNYHISRIMRLIIFEVSKVVAAMPELENVPTKEIRFAPERLERVVVGVAKKTAMNVSSMLQDVRNGKQTEIEYINGYVVNRGVELGIPCAVNFALREMVRGKLQMMGSKLRKDLPMDGSADVSTGSSIKRPDGWV